MEEELRKKLESTTKLLGEMVKKLYSDPVFISTQKTLAEYAEKIEKIKKLIAPQIESIKKMQEQNDSSARIDYIIQPRISKDHLLLTELKNIKKELEEIKEERKTKLVINSYQLPKEAKWEKLIIKFFDGHTVKITYDNLKTQTFNYKDMGFIDRKTNNPDTKWKFLIAIAENGGSLTNSKYDKRFSRNVKYEVNKRLKNFFGMAENPIFCYTKKIGYKPLFTILPEKD